MRQILRTGILLATLLIPKQASAAADLYFGLSLIDPEAQTTLSNQYLLIEDGVIKEIGSGQPNGLASTVLKHDMSGYFAMPGLIDTHAHPTLGPIYVNIQENGQLEVGIEKNDEISRHNARMLLAHGITTIRDPGGDTDTVLRFRKEVAEGLFPGPDSVVAGLIFDHPPFPMVGLIEDLSDRSIAEAVAAQANAGVDYIKLYTGLSAAELAEGIKAAHENNIRAVAHVGDVSWTVAARLGIDAVVHMMPTSPDLLLEGERQNYLDTRRGGAFEFFEWYENADLDSDKIKHMIKVMAREGVHIDATLIAFYLAFWGDQPGISDANNHLSHPASLTNWQTMFRFDLGWQADDYRRAKAVWPKVLQLTKMMHDAGVPMTLGTDQGNPFVAPGASLYQEMQLHADAGISNWDILKMATSEAADIMGLGESTGRIRSGLEADFIFLRRNPSVDLADIASVSAVVSNGTYFEASALRAN